MIDKYESPMFIIHQSGNLFEQAPDLERLYERLRTLIQAPSQNHGKMTFCPIWNRLVKRFTITYVSGDITYISAKDLLLDQIDSLTVHRAYNALMH